MKKDGFFRQRGIFVILFMVLFATAKSQVMWNLKGGWMSREAYFYDTHSNDSREKENFQEWMAGLEIEIPLSDKLNLETGLRYKRHHSFVENEYTIKTVGSSYTRTENRQFEAKSLIELPLRLTYKQPLGKDFSLHVGVGPYMSFIPDGSWRFYRNENNTNNGWSDSKWGDQLQVGLEPSVAINWKCLSLGATYNIPCFYRGYKDENKPVVMATLGIRFKSNVWKYVGATLLSVITVGLAASSAWSAANASSYNSSSYSDGSYSSGSYNSSSGGKSCKYCAGTGECRGDKYHCRGTGECKKCYGKGYDTIDGHPYTCGFCHGNKKCHYCGGTGKCHHCGGTGKR